MDFVIIPVIVSIVFFCWALIKKNGSMHQIGLYISAAAFMYLAINFLLIPAQPVQYNTSNIVITQGSTNTIIQASNQILNTGLHPQAEDVFIYEATAWLWIVICMVFCLAGVLTRLGGKN